MFQRLALQPLAPYFCPGIVPNLSGVNLSQPKHPAIAFYAGTGYKALNAALTRGAADSLAPKQQQYLEDLCAIIVQAKRRLPQTIYRGIKPSANIETYFKLKVGDTVQKPAFMSTSDDFAVAEDFAGRAGIILDLRVAPGSRALNIFSQGEEEWLFPPQSYYKIKKISDVQGRLTIEGVLFTAPQFQKPHYAEEGQPAAAATQFTGRVWTELPNEAIR